MSRLLLVAAGGLAREVLALEGLHERFRSIALLDDDPRMRGTSVAGHEVLGGLGLLREHPDARLLVCAGAGAARRSLVERLAAMGVDEQKYATVLHPRVRVPPGCRVGRGSILLEGVTMTCDVLIGTHVVVMPRVTLTHDDVVEDYATLCAGVTLGGGVRVGSAAYVGMNACIREGRNLGQESVLGMGAALVHDLPAKESWAGVPARPLTRSRGRRQEST